MTILEAIEEASEDAGILEANFAFANIKEFQSFVKSFTSITTSDPAHLVMPFEMRSTWVGGRRKVMVPLQGWIMVRIAKVPLNYRSAEVESLYISPCRAIAKTFISNLINSDIIDPEEDNITEIIKPEYMFISASLFGVSYQINLPVLERAC